MGMLDGGERWLEDVLETNESVTVTLRRGASTTTGVKAVVGESQVMITDPHGATLLVTSRDYFIRTSLYKFNGTAVKPQSGDVIEEIIDDGTLLQEVLPLGDEPDWRHSGPGRRTLRVHTKQSAP